MLIANISSSATNSKVNNFSLFIIFISSITALILKKIPLRLSNLPHKNNESTDKISK